MTRRAVITVVEKYPANAYDQIGDVGDRCGKHVFVANVLEMRVHKYYD